MGYTLTERNKELNTILMDKKNTSNTATEYKPKKQKKVGRGRSAAEGEERAGWACCVKQHSTL